MRYLVLYLALWVGMGSCTSLSLKKSGAKKADDNLALVDRYRQAVQSNDTTTMNSLLSDHYMGYGPSVTDSVNKSQALANWQNQMSTLYESVEYSHSETLLVTASTGPLMGDWVSNWALLTIKYKYGKAPVNVWINANYKIEQGKIVRSRSFYNEADVMRQLGFEMTTDSE